MSLLLGSSRRRKFLFAAAAIAAGAYASYRIYNSSAFAHRRKRFLQILSTLSICCEALSDNAESISILSTDLKSFLLSDDDSVPQSLKQAFKIGQSAELQGTVTVLSAALTRGLLRGVYGKPGKDVRTRGLDQPVKPGFQALSVKDADLAGEDVACREIREVCFTAKRKAQPRNEYDREHTSLSNGSGCQEWQIKSYTSGSDMQPWHTQRVGVVLDKLRKGKTSEDLVDKVFSKLFSEPSVGFASAIAGTLARNLVLAFFDTSNKQSFSSKNSSANGELKASETLEQKPIGYEKVIDVINTAPYRMLIAECIHTFISTAVTVYVDKTKDVNFYNDVVAGITNPSHRDPMKDVLTSVCNGAVETLVKTSYGVMVGENQGQNGFTHCNELLGENQCSPFTSGQGQLLSTIGVHIEKACSTSSEGLTNDVQSDAPDFSKAGASRGRLEGNNQGGVQSFIDGVSKTLAIPSNRKLVVDVAGTVTSEAVRSFVDVVLHTASNHISSKMHGSWDRVKSCVLDQQGLQLHEWSRDMAVKAFVLASVCLAICLHMLTSFQLLQKT